MEVFHFYQLTLFIAGCIILHFAQERKDPLQIYSALGLITMVVFSLSYAIDSPFSFFLIALIPGLYYLIPAPLMDEKAKETLSSDQIIILILQILLLIIASFGGFWSLLKYNPPVFASSYPDSAPPSMTPFHTGFIALICAGIIINVIKVRKQLFSHLRGLFALFSLAVPALIWIGCISPVGLEHMYSIFLLVLGIIVLIYSAKKSNLTVANLALGLIGLVMLCRFFDLKMSLTVKGILFILIGSSFFVANYIILKNKKHENSK